MGVNKGQRSAKDRSAITSIRDLDATTKQSLVYAKYLGVTQAEFMSAAVDSLMVRLAREGLLADELKAVILSLEQRGDLSHQALVDELESGNTTSDDDEAESGNTTFNPERVAAYKAVLGGESTCDPALLERIQQRRARGREIVEAYTAQVDAFKRLVQS